MLFKVHIRCETTAQNLQLILYEASKFVEEDKIFELNFMNTTDTSVFVDLQVRNVDFPSVKHCMTMMSVLGSITLMHLEPIPEWSKS